MRRLFVRLIYRVHACTCMYVHLCVDEGCASACTRSFAGVWALTSTSVFTFTCECKCTHTSTSCTYWKHAKKLSLIFRCLGRRHIQMMHPHSFYSDPATNGTRPGRLQRGRRKRFVTASWMASVPPKWFPFKTVLILGKRTTSAGAMFGLLGQRC